MSSVLADDDIGLASRRLPPVLDGCRRPKKATPDRVRSTSPHGEDAAEGIDIRRLQASFPELEIIELIGRGGMGEVYRARQVNLDRVVAFKVLPPRLDADPTFAARFTREAQTLAKLNHPNIVTVFEFGERQGLFYLLMEYVDGADLRHLMRDNTLSPQDALGIISQICDALQYAHDLRVVHRDIKPENILVDQRGQVKTADFGLVKLLTPPLPSRYP